MFVQELLMMTAATSPNSITPYLSEGSMGVFVGAAAITGLVSRVCFKKAKERKKKRNNADESSKNEKAMKQSSD